MNLPDADVPSPSAPRAAAATTVTPEACEQHGLLLSRAHALRGTLVYERPAYVHAQLLKDCRVGAFTYLNAAGSTSAYRTHFGRYVQVGESCIIGPPEHPIDGFSTHVFAYTRRAWTPNFFRLEEFARLAPDDGAPPAAADLGGATTLGHEAYVGAGSFIKRGVSIGAGAVIGARSVVTRDVPPYAIAYGNPARVQRMRFADALIERFLRLAWWRYDLAPYKNEVDFSQAEATLEFFEQRLAEGKLAVLRPQTLQLSAAADGSLRLKTLENPLFD